MCAKRIALYLLNTLELIYLKHNNHFFCGFTPVCIVPTDISDVEKAEKTGCKNKAEEIYTGDLFHI